MDAECIQFGCPSGELTIMSTRSTSQRSDGFEVGGTWLSARGRWSSAPTCAATPPGGEGVCRVDQGPRGAGADHRVGRRRRPPRGLPGAAPHPGRGLGRTPGRARPGPCRHLPRGGGPGHRPARGERAPGRDARRRGTRRDRATCPCSGCRPHRSPRHRDHLPDGGRCPHRLRQPDRPGADGRHRHDVGGGRDVRRVRGRPPGDPGSGAGRCPGAGP